MSLTLQEVDHVARLARLALSPEDSLVAARDLNRVIDFVDRLRQIDTSRIEPMSHVIENSQPLREDAITEREHVEEFGALAPEFEIGLYLVPRVIE